jgi:cytochrome b6-f complex iron-sulfur subunit
MKEQQTNRGMISRRGLLGKLLVGWGVLSAIPILNAVIRYLAPGQSAMAQAESIKFEAFKEIERNSAKIVRFGKEPAIIIHTEAGQYKAFMARCTHLGCVVKYETDSVPHLNCNCHGSVFDLTGKNLAGPAPRPLEPLRVEVEKDALIISRVARA